jgi:diacylglycerol kinase (ATP)
MDDVVLVVNPISGSPRRRNAVERYLTTLERGGLSVRVHPTRAPGDGARAAREAAAAGVRFVVAAGGDGTVNEAATGLLAAPPGTALAVLPLGTSNLVARHLGIPLRPPEAAAEAVLRPDVVTIDVGRAGDRTFVACAGIGLDAHIVADLAARRRGHIRYLSYAGPMWRTVRRYGMPVVTVQDTDSGHTVEGTQVIVLNMRPYAAFLEPAPDASAVDGLLDVVVLSGSGAARVLRWSLRAIRSRLLDDPDATRLRCRAVRVTSTVPAPVQIDGDVGGTTPVDMLVSPRALRILRPAARGHRRPT